MFYVCRIQDHRRKPRTMCNNGRQTLCKKNYNVWQALSVTANNDPQPLAIAVLGVNDILHVWWTQISLKLDLPFLYEQMSITIDVINQSSVDVKKLLFLMAKEIA